MSRSAEHVQHRGQIDLAVLVRQLDDLGAAFAQRGGACRCRASDCRRRSTAARRRESARQAARRAGCRSARVAAGAACRRRARSVADRLRAPCRCRSGSRTRGRATRGRRRAPASPVIHWLSPVGRPVRPSSVAATFMRTHGRPRVMRETKPMFSLMRLVREQPAAHVDAGVAQHREAASGDRRIRVFHRGDHASRRCASISAFAHGGVRPKWLHGSSVT